MKNLLKVGFEKFGVIIISISISILAINYNFRLDNLKNYNSLFSNTISFVSIFIGVLMTLVGLLLGYVNKEVIKRIRARNANDLLIKYFIFPIISGILIVIMSLVMGNLLDEDFITNNQVVYLLSIAWIYGVAYFIASTIRIMSLMLMILKEVFYEDIEIAQNENEVKKQDVDSCQYDDIEY